MRNSPTCSSAVSYTHLDVYKRQVQDLHRADIMVLPSLVEGFAHAVLEAMCCGVPVITTSNTCGPDIIRDGIEGFIVPPGDAQKLAERLEWARLNRRALRDMGVAAAARARQFTWARFRGGLRAAYTRMLTEQSEPPSSGAQTSDSTAPEAIAGDI